MTGLLSSCRTIPARHLVPRQRLSAITAYSEPANRPRWSWLCDRTRPHSRLSAFCAGAVPGVSMVTVKSEGLKFKNLAADLAISRRRVNRSQAAYR